jgi:bacteriocin biosynthesis cyclodehydratase domain-containing protein
VAGEDFRFTLSGPDLDRWLPGWLPCLDGRLTQEEAIGRLPPEYQAAAHQLLERLAGERLLVDGPLEAAHRPRSWRLAVEGTGALRPGLEALADAPSAGSAVAVLCQDTLDFSEALRFNERCLRGDAPWLWISCAALARGYVSPVFLPNAGPCLACLFGHFQRLSPLPDLYDELIRHGEEKRPFAAAPFPPPALTILEQLTAWKVDLLARPDPSAAVFLLHVLEVKSLEVTAHPVLVDPECLACRGRR